MNLEKNTKLCGFTVTRIREEKELGGRLVEMIHDKTGAELCWVDNKALNKTFCIGFKTLPENSTGVFHILEHSVLCGSDKYPVKEPFVELLKSSMNTFLNAMTFPDKTIYPVSSRNKRDFLNLTSVYLDAVFAPALKHNPNVFRQEGIHTEFDEEGNPSYKGVVFNEMKGAMSDVAGRTEYALQELLYPDTCYRFNSGGDPEVIPDLTYEQYVATYNTFYHPSNSRISLDGDVPLEETLEMINSYLEKYERSVTKHEIEMQTPAARESSAYYEIAEGEDNGKKTILVLAKIIGTWEERVKLLAAQVLADVLADTNESPLKRAVLSTGLAEDFEIEVMDGIAQPFISMTARNIKNEDSKKIRSIINETVKKIITEGIDKKSLTASINRLAYSVKQLPEPQGVYRAIAVQNSWLYDGDPMMYLVFDEAIKELRKMAEGSGFEKLLSELLENDAELSELHMLPSATFGNELREKEEARLAKETSALTDAQKQEIKEQLESLDRWQTEPDSPEAAATLPTLPLSEVSDKPELTETTEKTENGVKILYHPVQAHGIVYLTMYFPITNLTLDEITKLAILPYLYGELPTKNYSTLELQQQIKTYIGSLHFRLNVLGRADNQETCTPVFKVTAGMLEENLSQAKALIAEILLNTELNHPDKIKEIVTQEDEIWRQEAIGNGHTLGISAVSAHYTAKDAVMEAISGYSAINYLHKFAKGFDEMISDFLKTADRVVTEALIRPGLIVSVTSTSEADFADLFAALPEGKALPKEAEYKTALPEKLGISVPGQVSYAVKGYHLCELGQKIDGAYKVADNILTFCYLWNLIRVQGGAYGTGMRVAPGGRMFCYSYRDPSPARSLGIYDTLSDCIKDFCDGDEELDKLIISAIGNTEPLRTPASQGAAADDFYFTGITDEAQIKIRKEMLATDREKLLSLCGTLDKLAENGAICVVGHEAALKECGGLEIVEL